MKKGLVQVLSATVIAAVATSTSGAYAAQNNQANAAVPVYPARTLTLTDQKGDANGLNGQSLHDIGSYPTPVQNDGADLLKVEYVSTGSMVKNGKRHVPLCTGFTAKVTLAAPPAANTFYRLIGTAAENDGQWWLQYDGTRSTLRYSTIEEASVNDVHLVDLIRPVKVVGSTFTFTVTDGDMKASGEQLARFRINTPRAHSRARIGTAPGSYLTPVQWDEVKPHQGVFKPC